MFSWSCIEISINRIINNEIIIRLSLSLRRPKETAPDHMQPDLKAWLSQLNNDAKKESLHIFPQLFLVCILNLIHL